MAIHLGQPSPAASRDPPGRRLGNLPGPARQEWGPPVPSLFGLAPGEACRAAPVASRAVRSYRTLSPLPGPDAGRFAFCGAVSGVAPAGRYPAPCFRGARTFLTRPGFPIWPGAAIRPSGPVNIVTRAAAVKTSGLHRGGDNCGQCRGLRIGRARHRSRPETALERGNYRRLPASLHGPGAAPLCRPAISDFRQVAADRLPVALRFRSEPFLHGPGIGPIADAGRREHRPVEQFAGIGLALRARHRCGRRRAADGCGSAPRSRGKVPRQPAFAPPERAGSRIRDRG